MCGPHRHFAPLRPHTLQRIPQTVGIVATMKSEASRKASVLLGFNTASGR